MKLVYLLDGSQAYLKERIGSRYIVIRLYEFETEDGWHEIESKDEIIVDQVFESQPIEKKNAELKEIELKINNEQEKLRSIQSDVTRANNDLSQIKRSIVDEQRFIINKSELKTAKNLALFPQNKIMPIVMTDGEGMRMYGIKISMEATLSPYEKERQWGYKIYDSEERYGYSEFLDPVKGFIVNPTQEMIDAEIMERKVRFSEDQILSLEEKYLTPDEIEKKKAKVRLAKEKRDKEKQDKIEKLKKELESLQNPTT